MFYQDKPYFTGNKVKILIPKFENFNKIKALFIVSIYQKALAHLTWGIGSTTESIQEIKIPLPTIDSKIAFDFMESYIKELEAQRIQELEAYLEVTGLNDYELNAQEREALAIFACLSCHTEGKARSISNNLHNGDISLNAQYGNVDISAFSKPQYDKENKFPPLFRVAIPHLIPLRVATLNLPPPLRRGLGGG